MTLCQVVSPAYIYTPTCCWCGTCCQGPARCERESCGWPDLICSQNQAVASCLRPDVGKESTRLQESATSHSRLATGVPQEIAIEAAVADFETALWQAMTDVIEDIPNQGCVFHWAQAVGLWRKVQSIGLSTAYTSDQGTYDYVRRLMALPFIPQEHIPVHSVHQTTTSNHKWTITRADRLFQRPMDPLQHFHSREMV